MSTPGNAGLATQAIAGGARAYVPKRLVQRLVSAPGNRTSFHGAIVFTDLVNSTALAHQYLATEPPRAERLGQLLNAYFSDVFDTVTAHGGEVLRLDGDAMIALWMPGSGQTLGYSLHAATSAALALKSHQLITDPGLPDHPHRVAVTCGELHASLIQSGTERAFITTDGEPFAELRGDLSRGRAGAVTISPLAAKELDRQLTVAETEDGALEVVALNADAQDVEKEPETQQPDLSGMERRLLSPFVRDCLEGGLSDWIAEKRLASVAQIGLRLSDRLSLSAAIGIAQNALAARDAGLWDITISDKGPVLTVIFGLPPFAKLTAAQWAVQSARSISEELASHGAEVQIGVASGELLLGDVGSDMRRSEFLSGTVMMRATRLMQASHGEVLCDQATSDRCAARFDFAVPVDVVVKSKEAPIPAFAVTGEATTELFSGVAAPAIGRSSERSSIEALFSDADHQAAKLLVLEGEPGSGKSHLLRDAQKVADDAGHRVLNVVCNPIDAATPYFAFRTLLPKLVGLAPNSSGNRLEAAIALALNGHPLSRNRAAVEAAAEVAGASVSVGSVAAQARASQAEQVVVELFRSNRTTVILDDAQWLDTASSNLLRALLENVEGMRVLAASRRKEDGASLSDALQPLAEIIRLGRLQHDDIGAIACHLLGVVELPRPLSELISQRADGIPLFAEQIVFDLKQRGVVSVQNGRCAFRIEDIVAPSQPTSLRELIASRVDRLSPRDQVILKTASVVGRDVSGDMLLRISPVQMQDDALRRAALALVENGFIEPDLSDANAWSFRHRVIRDCVYGMLTNAQRRPIHAAVAQALLDDHQSDRAPVLGELAEHFEGAGDFPSAINYGEEAALSALSRFANADALSRLERVRHLIDDTPESDRNARMARVEFLSAKAYQGLSRFDDAARHYQNYSDVQKVSLPLSRGAILARLPMETAEQVLHRFGITGRSKGGRRATLLRQQAQMYTDHAEHAYFKNDSLQLLYFTMASLNRAERAQLANEMALGLGGMSIGLCAAGMHGLSKHYQKQSEIVVARADDDALRGFIYLLGAVALTAAGDWSEERRLVQAGMRTSASVGDSFRVHSCNVITAFSSMWRGMYEEANKRFMAYGPDAEGITNTPVRSWYRAGRATLQMTRDEPIDDLLDVLAVADDPELSTAERLLCRAVRSGVLLKLGHREEAYSEAAELLAEMKASQVTLGITLDGISAVALVHQDRLKRGDIKDSTLRRSAEDACTVAHKFSRQTLAGKSRAHWLSGQLDELYGRTKAARKRYQKSIAAARRYGIRTDEVAALASLGQLTGDHANLRDARKLVGNIGAKPWFIDDQLKQLIEPDTPVTTGAE